MPNRCEYTVNYSFAADTMYCIVFTGDMLKRAKYKEVSNVKCY